MTNIRSGILTRSSFTRRCCERKRKHERWCKIFIWFIRNLVCLERTRKEKMMNL